MPRFTHLSRIRVALAFVGAVLVPGSGNTFTFTLATGGR
jgi:hypothetical protein